MLCVCERIFPHSQVAVNDNPVTASGDSPSSSEDEDTAEEDAAAEKEPANEAESK